MTKFCTPAASPGLVLASSLPAAPSPLASPLLLAPPPPPPPLLSCSDWSGARLPASCSGWSGLKLPAAASAAASIGEKVEKRKDRCLIGAARSRGGD
eukprot:scaffold79988_cov63-Phaeocystis_antarctica.AAC.4